MSQAMQAVRMGGAKDSELIDLLSSISVISGRLAKNLRKLTSQDKSKKGGNYREQNERSGYGYRRLA